MDRIDEYNQQCEGKTAEEIIGYVINTLGKTVTLASSLGAEDQVLTAILGNSFSSVKVFVLDTGRLNQETYDVLEKTRKKYALSFTVFCPHAQSVQALMTEKGPNSFYESIENRKECCAIRKVEPLSRALSGFDAWITGLRRGQSVTRVQLPIIEWDEAHQMLKINPLANWTERQVWDYIKAHAIPTNALHQKGYPSIGCEPCTRAIKAGEDLRAGRWWWETPDQKECGLHPSGSKEGS